MTLHSILNPGPECTDHQPRQRVSSAGGGCRAAALRSAPGHSSGKDTHNYITNSVNTWELLKEIWLDIKIPTKINLYRRLFSAYLCYYNAWKTNVTMLTYFSSFKMSPLLYICLSLCQLTAKNIQCMRTLLNLAHCHGAVLGTSWQLVLATLQVIHLYGRPQLYSC